MNTKMGKTNIKIEKTNIIQELNYDLSLLLNI